MGLLAVSVATKVKVTDGSSAVAQQQIKWFQETVQKYRVDILQMLEEDLFLNDGDKKR